MDSSASGLLSAWMVCDSSKVRTSSSLLSSSNSSPGKDALFKKYGLELPTFIRITLAIA